MAAIFSVYFEGPFWVGMLESEEPGKLAVARHVFGAEPSNAELLRFMLYSYHLMPRAELPRSGPCGGRAEGLEAPRINPKRALRESRRAMATGPSSKARAALSSALEASKGEAAAHRRDRSRAEAERRYALRAEARKERHRGH